eukprot:CAMPEP_0170187298 /NCGR_PEP_ID=MMETSP0040_2-20121228/41356_1 /TAXON_ID=641309 /ORGANISM="Lotharella oceanica, Strain CCMP622" /LENGTH=172 /DNA_ID=CAMNT_0010434301 /DNA_START=72 /DNA_END=590 /DNA_ORIENTATION=+
MPELELPSGEKIGQTRSITRFIGKMSGLYPAFDALTAAKIDDVMDICEDLMTSVNKIGQGMEKAEKEKARAEGMKSGKPAAILKAIESYIGAQGKNGCAVGDKLTLADICIFSYTNLVVCGFYDGVSPDVLKDYPKIQAVRKTVGTHPKVVARYAAEKADTPIFNFYKSCTK